MRSHLFDLYIIQKLPFSGHQTRWTSLASTNSKGTCHRAFAKATLILLLGMFSAHSHSQSALCSGNFSWSFKLQTHFTFSRKPSLTRSPIRGSYHMCPFISSWHSFVRLCLSPLVCKVHSGHICVYSQFPMPKHKVWYTGGATLTKECCFDLPPSPSLLCRVKLIAGPANLRWANSQQDKSIIYQGWVLLVRVYRFNICERQLGNTY